MRASKTFTQTIARGAAIVLSSTLLVVASHPAKALGGKLAGEDTSRRNVVIIQGDGVRNTDSMEYVIDGKKSTNEKFENLNYEDILSVNWVSAENASKFFDNNGANVLFVATRNSEEGKKMLTKVNTVKNHKGQVFSAKKSGIYEMADGTFKEVKPDDDGVVTISGYGTGGGNEPLVVSNRPYKLLSSNSTKPYVYSVKNSGGGRVYVAGTNKTYKHSAATNKISYAIADDGSASVSKLDNKLIIINDKEAPAADLKKISAFDIEKMLFKDDDDTRDKYGDKAKNGVVYIYTKNAKK
ncbi:MAG: hypothetical protein V4577_00415 [Bacteroidota bacterium]